LTVGGTAAAPRPERLRRLKDVVVVRPRLLLVGINPGLRSSREGHHFAGNGNPFWRLLHAAGLTPSLLAYAEDQRLAEHGIALTNLCPRPTRTAAELSRAELVRGRATLARKIARWEPQVVAFVGVSLYRAYFGVSGGPGPGPKAEVIAGARVFVVPNPSGLNASFPGFAQKLPWFRALRAFVDAAEPPADPFHAGARRSTRRAPARGARARRHQLPKRAAASIVSTLA
jgi:TDG/mug DNA glycosylase family protein